MSLTLFEPFRDDFFTDAMRSLATASVGALSGEQATYGRGILMDIKEVSYHLLFVCVVNCKSRDRRGRSFIGNTSTELVFECSFSSNCNSKKQEFIQI